MNHFSQCEYTPLANQACLALILWWGYSYTAHRRNNNYKLPFLYKIGDTDNSGQIKNGQPAEIGQKALYTRHTFSLL